MRAQDEADLGAAMVDAAWAEWEFELRGAVAEVLSWALDPLSDKWQGGALQEIIRGDWGANGPLGIRLSDACAALAAAVIARRGVPAGTALASHLSIAVECAEVQVRRAALRYLLQEAVESDFTGYTHYLPRFTLLAGEGGTVADPTLPEVEWFTFDVEAWMRSRQD